MMSPFGENVGTIACHCVISGERKVLFVSHTGGDWQFYCSVKNHDFKNPTALERELTVVHIDHLVAIDPTLANVADLPDDMGAERDVVGLPWRRFVDKDD